MNRLFFLSAVLFWNFYPSPLVAQTTGTGAINGMVTDPSGIAVDGVIITATNSETGQVRTTATDSGGSYNFGLLAPGAYQVEFSKSGYKTLKITSVTVNVADTRIVNEKLEPGLQTEEVTVPWNAQSVQAGMPEE